MTRERLEGLIISALGGMFGVLGIHLAKHLWFAVVRHVLISVVIK